MNDLISRSALLELYADTDEIKFDVYNVPVPVVRQNILDMPTIDAEPVRHGRWEPHPHAYGFERCSVCHDCNIWGEWADGKKWRYCPNCGAKMDGDTE